MSDAYYCKECTILEKDVSSTAEQQGWIVFVYYTMKIYSEKSHKTLEPVKIA